MSEPRPTRGACRYLGHRVHDTVGAGLHAGPACVRYAPREGGEPVWVKPAEDWCGEFSPTAPDPSPELEAAKAQLGKLAQALAAAKAEIEALKQDRAHEARKLQIEAFEAETNRLRALQR
jgi:hypothetical protein